MTFSFPVTDAPCFETHRFMARRVRAGSVSASSILAAYKYIFHIHLLAFGECMGSALYPYMRVTECFKLVQVQSRARRRNAGDSVLSVVVHGLRLGLVGKQPTLSKETACTLCTGFFITKVENVCSRS